MTNDPVKLVSSTSLVLTSAPVVFAADPHGMQASVVRVWSSVQFHVAVGDAADTNALPIAAGGEGVLLHLDAGDDVSAVKGSGAPDGIVWFTVVRRY